MVAMRLRQSSSFTTLETELQRLKRQNRVLQLERQCRDIAQENNQLRDDLFADIIEEIDSALQHAKSVSPANKPHSALRLVYSRLEEA